MAPGVEARSSRQNRRIGRENRDREGTRLGGAPKLGQLATTHQSGTRNGAVCTRGFAGGRSKPYPAARYVARSLAWSKPAGAGEPVRLGRGRSCSRFRWGTRRWGGKAALRTRQGDPRCGRCCAGHSAKARPLHGDGGGRGSAPGVVPKRLCKGLQTCPIGLLFPLVPAVSEQPRTRAVRRLASRRGQCTGRARPAASATMDARQRRGRADDAKRKEAGSGNDETQGLRELPMRRTGNTGSCLQSTWAPTLSTNRLGTGT